MTQVVRQDPDKLCKGSLLVHGEPTAFLGQQGEGDTGNSEKCHHLADLVEVQEGLGIPAETGCG